MTTTRSREQTLVDQIIGEACKRSKPLTEDDLDQDLRAESVALRVAAMAATRLVWKYAEHAARTERTAERCARVLAEHTRHLVEAPLAVSANAVGVEATSWLYDAGVTEGLRQGAAEALQAWLELRGGA